MNGAEMLAQIQALAREFGELVHHEEDSRRDLTDPGFPDVVIAGGYRVLFRELKPDGRKPSAGQVAWKWALLAGAADWGVWTPRDLFSGKIRAEMESASRRKRSDADSRPQDAPQSDSGAVSGTE